MNKLVLVLLIALSACGTGFRPSTPMPDGAVTKPVPGWIDYCRRHKEEPTCPSN